MDFNQNKIGGNIAALRKAKGLTQEQLADMLGVSAPAVSKWETGSSYPDISLLCPLARALTPMWTACSAFMRSCPTGRSRSR